MQTALPSEMRRWMSREVMPFWCSHAINSKTGLSFESLNPDGTPNATADLRVRVQFRQIYSFSHAAALGWFPEGRHVAMNLWDRVSQTCRAGTGKRGFVHSLKADLTVLNAKRDAYDHAFSILALSWLARATGDTQVIHEIESILAFVDEEMTDSLGLLTEGIPAQLPRRQNPQMHWFEAMLALHDATGHQQGQIRAERHLSLFKHSIMDRGSDIFGEYFNDDWSVFAGETGQYVEPGHMAEWVWLLRSYERMFKLERDILPSRMLDRAEQYLDPKTGLLPDRADRKGNIVKPTRRIWLQTELCKAWVAETESGRENARGRALETLADLKRYYLGTPFPQGWVDQVSAEGAQLAGPVQASILYHVFLAIAEADRVLSV